MTKYSLPEMEAKVTREALRAYVSNLERQLRHTRMTRPAEIDAQIRHDVAKNVLEGMPEPKPAPKPRKPRKPAAKK